MIAPSLYRYTVVCVRRYNGHKIESAVACVEAADGHAAVARALDKLEAAAPPRPGSPWWPAYSFLGSAADATPTSHAGHLGTLHRDPRGEAA